MIAYIGIDYSMTGPAMCINIADEYFYFSMTKVKKHQMSFTIGKHHFTIIEMPKVFKNNIERYSYISRKFLEYILLFDDVSEYMILIEGYSMGSKGNKILNIAENCQTLKLRLYNQPNVNLIEPSVPPKTVKKFATDNGNADKELMYEFWCKSTLINTITDHLDCDIKKSPISDLVDSYWIMMYLIENYGEKK